MNFRVTSTQKEGKLSEWVQFNLLNREIVQAENEPG